MNWKAIAAAILSLAVAAPAVADAAKTKTSHALSLIGEPKYGYDFPHLDHANPDAPKGGDLRQYSIGTFDSLHPFIIKGVTPAGISLTYDALMTGTLDDISAEYGLIAESVTVPDDLTWVEFTLRPEARWHDGKPITPDDVIEAARAAGR